MQSPLRFLTGSSFEALSNKERAVFDKFREPPVELVTVALACKFHGSDVRSIRFYGQIWIVPIRMMVISHL